MAQFSTVVAVGLEKVWEHLLFKIENPQHFVPGVGDVKIVEKTADYVIREMVVTTTETSLLKEKITFVPYHVRFLLLEHPKLEGYVDNVLEEISENETKMTFTIYWVDKATQTAIANYELVQKAVLKTKTFIENNT